MKTITHILFLLVLQTCILQFFACTNTSGKQSASSLQTAGYQIEEVANNLDVPWGMEFLPDGRLMFNERSGDINILDIKTGEVNALMQRKNSARAEGGLLGLAVDPNFETTHWIFIYETVKSGNQIVRLKFLNNILTEDSVIVNNIPSAMFHDGGILSFGPDGFLYAGTGDATDPQNAQDLQSLAGKILRMDINGNAVDGNPFGNLIYSYGHRNVQGFAWDNYGNMYATEHGPSGEINGWCCHDEFNKIIPGGNYGWPYVIGNDNKENMLAPLIHSGDDTWAPGGLAFVNSDNTNTFGDTFIMACLRGSKLIVIQTVDDSASVKEILFDGTYKRLRNIIAAPDNSILFCSSNMDGRESSPLANDDKIYRMRFK
ncbi:MAG: PQQ-dependent sugar dehydrogenase [Chitinophagales bacterium]|nr:PQQ-dependent sugar dehydrogenase [Bacteroidota bacterium]MBP7398155.1 PQQ-dependent sugar dehydrogenase [Chitinophagales bacterium]MBP8753141.1 PQQ-dependent sugar dehydrogenase [Chitinophagales bacterium]MBP9189130.1 PQQ-dependent sugar dehydrogenase [Chitinophagales bacterium]MBP9548462.1 PQQ-dependent sugar dehydrogenase [Chitinophagales bacterium]